MKTTIGVTIDTEILIKAKKKIDNISGFVEDKLRNEVNKK